MSSAVVRLYEIIVTARQIRRGNPIMDTWKAIFGVKDNADVWRKVALLHVLLDSASQEAMKVSPSQTRNISYWHSGINTALLNSSRLSESTWSNFLDHIDDHTVGYLSAQAELCKHQIKHSPLDPEKISNAIACLNEAIKEIESSELSIEVKLGMIRRLRSLVNALSDYKITGDEAIFDEFKVTLIDMASAKSEGNDIPAQSKVRECLGIIADLMSTADGASVLTAPISRLLGLIP